MCIFNPSFEVRNSNYRKYLKNNPALNHGNTLGKIGETKGKHHWDSTLFALDGSKANFLKSVDFSKKDNIELSNEIAKNISTVGFRFFHMMSNFDGILNFYLSGYSSTSYQKAPMLIDLCYLYNRTEKLELIFNWFSQKENRYPNHWLEKHMMIRKNNYLQHNI
ncbi:hypothetical protein [Winogradskyella luteola]|uniref:Uncharacterized protein n=1 Tax=Winogradskyella luteola TaxID=2828330 RepID=A0A9X1FBM1_9FLAO|nr:hypothetical protein [Winogradskyella luteola]MBV7270621.1 hypothetical protein [Winogradskyella luteola]